MKVYIVEAHDYDADHYLAVCASIDKAKDILKAKAEELPEDGDGSIDWDADGLGFYWYDGLGFLVRCKRYHITETEVLQ